MPMKLTRRDAMRLMGGGLVGAMGAVTRTGEAREGPSGAKTRPAAKRAREVNVRRAARAGTFYPAAPVACRREAAKLIAAAKLPADLPKRICGGIVPHAGWKYSATLAACRILGAKRGRCLAYTNGCRVVRRIDPNIKDETTVGYASVIFPAGRGSASSRDERTDR